MKILTAVIKKFISVLWIWKKKKIKQQKQNPHRKNFISSNTKIAFTKLK